MLFCLLGMFLAGTFRRYLFLRVVFVREFTISYSLTLSNPFCLSAFIALFAVKDKREGQGGDFVVLTILYIQI